MAVAIDILRKEHRILQIALDKAKSIAGAVNEDQFLEQERRALLFFRNYTETVHFPKIQTISKYVAPSPEADLTAAQLDVEALLAEMVDAYVQYDVRQLRMLNQKFLAEMGAHLQGEASLIDRIPQCTISTPDLAKIEREFQDIEERNIPSGTIIKYFGIEN